MLECRFVGFIAALALCVSGCGTKKSEPDRSDFLGEMLSAVCSSVATCCNAASLDLDNQKCHDDVLLHIGGSINDPQLAYDAQAGQGCLDAIQASVAACQAIDYTPCIKAFSGNQPPGASCS